MSLSQSAVANKIRLLKLTDAEQRLVLEKDLSERHARALLRLESTEARTEAINYIAATAMNVINTEQYIDGVIRRAASEKAEKPAKYRIPGINEHKTKLFINGIQKKVELLRQQGQSALCEISEGDESIEIRVTLSK